MNDLDPNIIIPSVIAAYAAIKSTQAARYSKPTGNGFAEELRHTLRRIERRLDNHIDKNHG